MASSLDYRPARFLASILALAGLGLVSACSQASTTSASSTLAPLPTAAASGWVDQPVSFQAGGLTIHATFRHRSGSASAMPAVLLIAGSGPTDRNGNSPLISGPVDTLEQIAEWLSADGVASLRYDKLGSGQTGLGPFANRPAAIGIAPFEQEAAAGLRFLAAQPGIDRARLGVIGHSEGALFALLLATGATGGAGPVPPVHALGLFEPLSERYLDLIAIQVDAQLAAARKAGQITAGQASTISLALTRAIAQLRASGTVPAGLPDGLPNVLNSGTALFLSQADRYDPAQLAAHLAPGTPVLVTCSNADLQVSCGEVHHLLAGLAQGQAATDFVQLTGVDHVLKQDPTGSAANYGQPRPFSPQLQQALRLFVERYL
jgi:dienelactone hydrolase